MEGRDETFVWGGLSEGQIKNVKKKVTISDMSNSLVLQQGFSTESVLK